MTLFQVGLLKQKIDKMIVTPSTFDRKFESTMNLYQTLAQWLFIYYENVEGLKTFSENVTKLNFKIYLSSDY